jgi:hypothetical protein
LSSPVPRMSTSSAELPRRRRRHIRRPRRAAPARGRGRSTSPLHRRRDSAFVSSPSPSVRIRPVVGSMSRTSCDPRRERKPAKTSSSSISAATVAASSLRIGRQPSGSITTDWLLARRFVDRPCAPDIPPKDLRAVWTAPLCRLAKLLVRTADTGFDARPAVRASVGIAVLLRSAHVSERNTGLQNCSSAADRKDSARYFGT